MAVMDRNEGDICLRHGFFYSDTSVTKHCPQCDEEWRCPDCREICYDDPRVENGMKCFSCTYDYRGGE